MNPKELLELLERSWSAESSADPKGWTSNNPSWGQCAVTTLVIQDFLGGEILRASLADVSGYEDMRSHYWNCLPDGSQLDLTQAQFDKDKGAYAKIPAGEARTREYLMSSEGTRMRFARLRLAVEAELRSRGFFDAYLTNPLFSDSYFIECFAQAQLSGCQKRRVGCIAVHKGKIVARGTNAPHEALKRLCEPKCMRMDIASGMDSMLGACMHAEEYVLDEIRKLGIDSKECSIYVAGFNIDNTTYSRKWPEFTCLRCSMQLYRVEIGAIYVQFDYQWVRLSAQDVLEQSIAYAMGEKNSGRMPNPSRIPPVTPQKITKGI